MRRSLLLLWWVSAVACGASRAASTLEPLATRAKVLRPAPSEARGGTSGGAKSAATPPARSFTSPDAATERLRRALTKQGARVVGRKQLRRQMRREGLPDDCSGYVRWVFAEQGIDLIAGAEGSRQTGVRAIHETARRAKALHRGTPAPGDLVFFRETYDRNGDGRRNDGLTHIGIVESIEPDGRVVFLHRANSGVRRSVLDLERPRVHRSKSRELINDYLRAGRGGVRARLTGELFAGWASAEKLAEDTRERKRGNAARAARATGRRSASPARAP